MLIALTMPRGLATAVHALVVIGSGLAVGLWYAYRRVHGVLYKGHVGKSAGLLTRARLEETAVWLNEVW